MMPMTTIIKENHWPVAKPANEVSGTFRNSMKNLMKPYMTKNSMKSIPDWRDLRCFITNNAPAIKKFFSDSYSWVGCLNMLSPKSTAHGKVVG